MQTYKLSTAKLTQIIAKRSCIMLILQMTQSGNVRCEMGLCHISITYRAVCKDAGGLQHSDLN